MIASGIQKINEYERDSLIPIAKVLYTDSPYGVNSLGYAVDYYNNSTGSLDWNLEIADIAFHGHDNILSYDWSYGVPPGITSIYFKARFYGYFYANFDGNYRFMVSTDPSNKVRLYMDSDTPDSAFNASGIFEHAEYLQIENLSDNGTAWTQNIGDNETWFKTITLQSGEWYAWGIEFINTQDKANLSLRFVEPESVTGVDGKLSDHDPYYRSGELVGDQETWGWIDSDEPTCGLRKVFHPKVMSAGVTNYRSNWTDDSEATFETPIEIAIVNQIDGAHDMDKSSEFGFTVPINSDPYNSDAEGFALNPDTGLFTEQATNVQLRHGRKVSVYFGYQSACQYAGGASCDHSNAHITPNYEPVCETGGNYRCPANTPLDADYVQVFEGIITNIDISETKNKSQLKISCQDQMTFMLSTLNENYPNDISYAQFGFASDRTSREPNGLTRPNAYDGWPLAAAVRDLCLKSKIDTTWLYGRKKIINAESNIVYGDYFIDDYGLLLRRKSRYGNPLTTDLESSDDEYIWSYNFGEIIHGMITKMADLYGYTFRIGQDGYVQCAPIDAPRIHVPDWTYDSYGNVIDGTWDTHSQEWAAQVDSRSDGGRYYECGIEHAPLKKTLTGSKFQIGIVRGKANKVWDNIYRHKDGSESEWLGASLHNYTYFSEGDLLGPVTTYYKFRDWLHAFSVDIDVTVENMYIRLNHIDEVHKFADGAQHPDKHNEIDVKWYFYIVNDPTDLVNKTASVLFENTDLSMTLYEEGTLALPEASHPSMENYIVTIPFVTPPTFVAGTTYAIKFVQEDTNPGSVGLFLDEKWDFKSQIQGVKQEQPDSTVVTAIYRDITYYGAGIELEDEKTYGKNIDDLPIYLNIWVDSIVEFEEEYSTCRIDIFRTSTEERVTTLEMSNGYDGYTPHTDNLIFPRDGIDMTGKNPCMIDVPSMLLHFGDYNGILLSYDTYRFEIVHSGVDGSLPTRVTSIFSYSDDIDIPVYHFDTFRNISKIDGKSTIEDMRNDVIVIGDKLGKVEDIDGEVINRNNPTYDYVYSRATDAASIYQLDAINNVGRQAPFVIMEPAITDQRHADWLAQAVLNKYRLFRVTPGWASMGYSFIEPYDPVHIRDIVNNTMYDSRMQWLTSCKHSFDYGKYQMSMNSTPYRPWSSYTPRPRADIKDFKDEDGNPQPFINIKLETSYGSYCGSNLDDYEPMDVYAVEESGYRLKITFDQIIDGFVTIKVYKNGITNPVAWLVGSVAEDGFERDEYRERGYNYELLWDCTDETSASRTSFAIDPDESWQYIDNFKTEQGLYATSGDYYVVFELAPSEQNEGFDEEADRYVISTKTLPVSLNTSIANTLGFDEGTYAQFWNIKWGDPTFGIMNVSRPKDDGTYEECTYPHNLNTIDNHGLSFNMLNDPKGLKFEFEFLNDVPRLVYFNIDAQIIRGTAIESGPIHEDIMTYAKGMWHSYLGVKSSSPTRVCKGFVNSYDDPSITLTDFIQKYEYWTHVVGSWFTYYEEWTPTQGNLPLNERHIYNYLHDYDLGYRDANVPYYTTLRKLSVDSDHEENHEQLTAMDLHVKFAPGENESDGRIIFWTQEAGMPYEDVDIKDYIKAFSKKVTSYDNVTFTYNPNRITQVNIDYHKIPHMEEHRAELFKQALATVIWLTSLSAKRINSPGNNPDWSTEVEINSDEMKPSIYTATYTQPIIRIWDKTGRYINSTQTIYNGAISHSHTNMSNCTNDGMHYVSEGSVAKPQEIKTTYFSSKFSMTNCGFSATENHEHPEFIRTCWLPIRRHYRSLPSAIKAAKVASSDFLNWAYYIRGNLKRGGYDTRMRYHELKKIYMYDMTINGLGEHHTWGIGLVNSDKFSAPPGAFTWHGYVHITAGAAGHALTSIPFDTTSIKWTDHWRAYINDDEQYPSLYNEGRTLSRIVGACEPESYEYTHENATTNLMELFALNYYNEFGSINTSIDEYIGSWDLQSFREDFVSSGYTSDQFHIHFPVAETMPLFNMDYMHYMSVDDFDILLENLGAPTTPNVFHNGETQGDWNIGVGKKQDSDYNWYPYMAYAGTSLRPDSDSQHHATERTWIGASIISTMNMKPNYPNPEGQHYAWYKNPRIQIPDWHVPSDLSNWEEIPHVMSFGVAWGV